MNAAAPTFGDVAPRLQANGYWPVPIARGGKNPLPTDWPRYTYRPGDERDYPNCGAGLLTGHGYIAGH